MESGGDCFGSPFEIHIIMEGKEDQSWERFCHGDEGWLQRKGEVQATGEGALARARFTQQGDGFPLGVEVQA